MRQKVIGITAAAVLFLALSSCGGGTSPAAPSSGGSGSPSSGNITITMTSSGVTPNPMQVSQGTRVLFLNNDARQHEMTSDPHPEHDACVEINNVGFINPGQTKETGNLNTIRTCGYHDHNDPTNTRFQGRIIIVQ